MIAIHPAKASAKITKAPEETNAKGFETDCALGPGVSAAAGVEADEEAWVCGLCPAELVATPFDTYSAPALAVVALL
jgi:hypothetical protein